MKDIHDLLVVQVRLFPVDTIPIDVLASPSGRQALRSEFGFQEASLDLPVVIGSTGESFFALQNGEFQDSAERIVVRSLDIHPRRMVCRVAGTSKQADKFFSRLTDVIREVRPDSTVAPSSVIYKAEDTSCVATLNIDFAQIFRRSVSSFVHRRLAKVATEPKIQASAYPFKFAARITYDVRDPNVKGHGIIVSPKEFVIEPRMNTPLEDRIFFTKSPFPSDKHFQLVEEFEGLFASST
jgi:hypothetical protein